ncbi:uncharacterized protein LOC112547605 isoform X2 [Pelodiscus sinensis]
MKWKSNEVAEHVPLSAVQSPVSESNTSRLRDGLRTASHAAVRTVDGKTGMVLAECRTEPFRETDARLRRPSWGSSNLRWQHEADGAAPRDARFLVKEEIEEDGYGTGSSAQQYPHAPGGKVEAPPCSEHNESYSPCLGKASSQGTRVGVDLSRGGEDQNVLICKTEIMEPLEAQVAEEPYPGEPPACEQQEARRFWCATCDRDFLHRTDLVRHGRVHGGERPFRCDRCSKGFRRRSHLNEHLLTHTGEKPFPCRLCAKSFGRRSTLTKHQETHAKEGPRGHTTYQREPAWRSEAPKPHRARRTDKADPRGRWGDAVVRPAPAAQQERTRTGEKPFSCGVCGKSFSTRSYAAKHERAHQEERPHPGPGSSAGQRAQAERQRAPEGEKPFPCGLCGRWFRRRSHLNEHLRSHTGEKPFPCRLCTKKFTRRSTLTKHQQTHAQPGLHPAQDRQPLRKPPRRSPPAAKPYPCRACHKSFSTQAYARWHERAHAGERPALPGRGDRDFGRRARPVQCKAGPGVPGNGVCSQLRTFKEESPPLEERLFPGPSVPGRELEHPPAPVPDKPYPCGLCEKSFPWPSKLSEHPRSHVAEQLHPYPLCSRSFRSPRALKRHQLSHVEEKPFSCRLSAHRRAHLENGPSQCARRLVFWCDLLKPHGFPPGERPYPCSRCTRRFRRRSHLTDHLRIHTGEKPFLCKACGKRFGRRSTLTKHQQIHARRAPLCCTHCRKSFTAEAVFVLHQKLHGRAAGPSM